MITLTKLNGVTFILNCDLIEHMSANPDTTIYLTNGNFYIVRESVEEVVKQVIAYRREIFCNLVNPNAFSSENL